MTKCIRFLAALGCAILLAGCDKATPPQDTPVVTEQSEAGAPQGPCGDETELPDEQVAYGVGRAPMFLLHPDDLHTV